MQMNDTDWHSPFIIFKSKQRCNAVLLHFLKSLGGRNKQGEQIASARLPDHQFEGAEGRGARIRHRDIEGVDHSTLVYLLVGKTFTASCIVQFLDADGQDVLPLVKDTLDSIRGIDAPPPGTHKPATKRP